MAAKAEVRWQGSARWGSVCERFTAPRLRAEEIWTVTDAGRLVLHHGTSFFDGQKSSTPVVDWRTFAERVTREAPAVPGTIVENLDTAFHGDLRLESESESWLLRFTEGNLVSATICDLEMDRTWNHWL